MHLAPGVHLGPYEIVAPIGAGGMGEVWRARDPRLGRAKTGGVITSAVAVMVAVFAAFTLGDFVLMKMLGFALAVAVLLDAAVIRTAIGPALLRLAGRFNWWPR